MSLVSAVECNGVHTVGKLDNLEFILKIIRRQRVSPIALIRNARISTSRRKMDLKYWSGTSIKLCEVVEGVGCNIYQYFWFDFLVFVGAKYLG